MYQSQPMDPEAAKRLTALAGGTDVVGESDQKDNPGTPSVCYEAMAELWALPLALLSGTLGMRAMREEYLPRFPLEEQEDYERRLRRTVLFEAFRTAIDYISSRPFTRPIDIENEEKLPDFVMRMINNSDGQGTTLAAGLQDTLKKASALGVSHIFVDYPSAPGTPTLADDKVRTPRCIYIPAQDMLFWKNSYDTNGTPVLEEIRFKYEVTVPKGTYGDELETRVRRVTRTDWTEWRRLEIEQDGRKKVVWQVVSEGTHTFGGIPLVPYYTEKTGFMTARPPMEQLAWLNQKHWADWSDQSNAETVARIALLFGTGFTEEEVQNGIALGPNSPTLTTNVNAKMEYIEQQGGAINAGREAMKDLMEMVENAAMRPFVQKSGGISATGRAMDEAKGSTLIQAWVLDLEDVALEVLKTAAKWRKQTLADDVKVNIYSDFALSMRARDDILALLEARLAGELPRDVFLAEIQRRELISQNYVVSELIRALEAEEKKKEEKALRMAEAGAQAVDEANPKRVPRMGGTGMGVAGTAESNRGGTNRRDGREKTPASSSSSQGVSTRA
jgi:hypothetical protein